MKLVQASILLLALAGSSQALSQPEGQPEWLADAKQVAAQEGISVGEAVRRFQLSEKAGRLQERFAAFLFGALFRLASADAPQAFDPSYKNPSISAITSALAR